MYWLFFPKHPLISSPNDNCSPSPLIFRKPKHFYFRQVFVPKVSLATWINKHRPEVTAFYKLLTHVFKTKSPFFKTLHTILKTAHTKCKVAHISFKMQHCIQNAKNTCQNKAFASNGKHFFHNNKFLDIPGKHCCSKSKALWSFIGLYLHFNTMFYSKSNLLRGVTSTLKTPMQCRNRKYLLVQTLLLYTLL